MEDTSNRMPENIEEYILTGINNYQLSDNQIIDNLHAFGMSKSDAEKKVTETRKKHGLYTKKHLFDGETDAHTWVVALFYFAFVLMNLWSFVQIIQDKDLYGYGGNVAFAHTDAVLAGCMVALSFFTTIRVFLCRKDGAFLSYACFTIAFLSSLLCAIYSIGETERVLKMIACSIVFGLFLILSDTIKKHFIKTTRHIYWFDIVIVASVLLISAFTFFIERHNIAKSYEMSFADYQNDLINYIERTNAQTPILDSVNGVSIDSINYTTYDGEINAFISTIENGNENVNNVLGNIQEYFSEPSITFLLYCSLPDSLTYYMYGTGAFINVMYSHANGKQILQRKYSYDELMDTFTNEQWAQHYKDMNRYQIDLNNAMCPQMINETSTLVSCEYQEKGNYNVYYIKVGIDIKDISIKGFEQQMYQTCRASLLLQKSGLITRGAGIRYKFYDKNNAFITTIDFTLDQIKALK